MTGPVRVLTADDHPIVRDGLRGMFEDREGFDVVGEARDGMEALALLARVAADVVLMDLRMPRLDGPGATGYLLKDAPREELFRAVSAAARGEAVLAPSVAARVMRRLRPGRDEGALSAREVEVVDLVRHGAANRDIAARLHISEATVKTHLLHAYAKLGVNDRTAAVVVALERGVLTL